MTAQDLKLILFLSFVFQPIIFNFYFQNLSLIKKSYFVLCRLRDSQGRFGYLVEEIDNLRRENEYIALEIQRRQQADGLSRVNQGKWRATVI